VFGSYQARTNLGQAVNKAAISVTSFPSHTFPPPRPNVLWEPHGAVSFKENMCDFTAGGLCILIV